MTLREIISTVRNSVKALTLDDRLSNRYVYSLLLHYTNFFIKRDSDARRIFKQTHLFKTVNCFELEERPLIECSNILIPNCKTVMRSKKKLPKVYNTIYGNLLDVFSVDGSVSFTEGSPNSYSSYKSREFKPKNKGFYFIENDYLIIPDSSINAVMLRGLFVSNDEVKRLNGDEGDGCKSKLDEEFIAPDYLIADIVKSVTVDIRNINGTVLTDNNPNRNNSEKEIQNDANS